VLSALRLSLEALASSQLAAQVGERLFERSALVRGLGPEPCGMRVPEVGAAFV
jgi:hypothetical protein